jgi:hypothetical protein
MVETTKELYLFFFFFFFGTSKRTFWVAFVGVFLFRIFGILPSPLGQEARN